MKFMVNNYKLVNKEECLKYTGAIKNNGIKGGNCRAKIVDGGYKDIVTYIEAGNTIIPAVLDEGKPLKDEYFRHQQLFGLDFDNESEIKGIRVSDDLYIDYDRIMNICDKYLIKPMVIYETFSSKESWKKYRVMFATNGPITDKRYRNEIITALMKIFSIDGKVMVDSHCKDLSRIFYAGRTVLYSHDNYVNPDKIIEKTKTITLEPSSTSYLRGQNSCESIKKDINISSLWIHQNPNLIKDSNINALRALVSQNTKIFDSMNECVEYITTELDLSEFLGIPSPKSFKCIFHDDKHPSASIFTSRRGEQFYCCNSNSCGFKGNIIRVVENIQRCNRSKAIRFIMAVYGLTIKKSLWVQEQKENCNENVRFLMSGEFKETEPFLYSISCRYLSNLIAINAIAQQFIISEEFMDKDGNGIFFISQRKLSQIIGTSQGNISKRMAFFDFIKMCNKIDDADVPVKLYERAKAEALKNHTKDTIQFYSIPSYCTTVLENSTVRAKEWKTKGYTMRGMSREMIYRGSGEEVANKTYSKRKYIAPPIVSDQFQEKFEKLLHQTVKRHGYAREAEVIAKMGGRKNMNEIRVKRIIAQSLDKLGYKKIRANKYIKAQYNVQCKGYPNIIVIDTCIESARNTNEKIANIPSQK